VRPHHDLAAQGPWLQYYWATLSIRKSTLGVESTGKVQRQHNVPDANRCLKRVPDLIPARLGETTTYNPLRPFLQAARPRTSIPKTGLRQKDIVQLSTRDEFLKFIHCHCIRPSTSNVGCKAMALHVSMRIATHRVSSIRLAPQPLSTLYSRCNRSYLTKRLAPPSCFRVGKWRRSDSR